MRVIGFLMSIGRLRIETHIADRQVQSISAVECGLQLLLVVVWSGRQQLIVVVCRLAVEVLCALAESIFGLCVEPPQGRSIAELRRCGVRLQAGNGDRGCAAQFLGRCQKLVSCPGYKPLFLWLYHCCNNYSGVSNINSQLFFTAKPPKRALFLSVDSFNSKERKRRRGGNVGNLQHQLHLIPRLAYL